MKKRSPLCSIDAHAAVVQRRNDRGCCRRSGVLVLEFILAFPVIVIASFALFEFGMIMLVLQTIETAAVEGAREAAKIVDPSTVTGMQERAEVVDHIDQFLSVHDIPARRIVIEDPDFAASDTDDGDNSIPCSGNGATPVSGDVRVTICLYLSENDRPVPNMLVNFGINIDSVDTGATFEVSALAQKE